MNEEIMAEQIANLVKELQNRWTSYKIRYKEYSNWNKIFILTII